MPDENKHDPCIKNLPGVMNACCGHGVEDGYIQFEDGRVIHGKFNVEVWEENSDHYVYELS